MSSNAYGTIFRIFGIILFWFLLINSFYIFATIFFDITFHLNVALLFMAMFIVCRLIYIKYF